MLTKLILAIGAPLIVYVGLALGNLDALRHPHLWVLALLGFFASMTQPAYKNVVVDKTAPPEDQGTSVRIVRAVYITQVVGVLEAVYWRYPDSFRWDVVSSVALILAIAGLLFRAWAVRELGKYFTWHIEIQDDHQLVSTGPYRWVRHPSYTGALFLYVSTLLITHSWVATIAALLAMLWAFSVRIVYEEAILQKALGKKYVEYSRSVKTIIPYVW